MFVFQPTPENFGESIFEFCSRLTVEDGYMADGATEGLGIY